jgi:predicted Rossmann fold flavoprotein
VKENKTLIIIGGGAAGFFCAINAAFLNKNLQVIILEKTSKLLSKVKVSGGGRCNVTHHCFDIVELSKKYPRGASFLKKCFHQFNTNDTIQWFITRGVQLHTETDGRMFPTTNDSQTIIDCLLKEAYKNNVIIKTNVNVQSYFKKENKFIISTNKEEKIECDYLCIASGGYPKLDMFDWFSKNENVESEMENKVVTTSIISPIPSLFTFNMPQNPITALMGVSVNDVVVKIKGTKFVQQGPILITHWGLSGPAVLKLSAFAALDLHKMNYQFNVSINWLSNYNETSLQQYWKTITSNVQQIIANHNPFKLPIRLWDYLVQFSGVDGSCKWQDVTKERQNVLIKNLTNFEAVVNGKTTFKEEFVTSGGVDLIQIDHNTMEHKSIDNLFFAGEVLNIDGITGGFNFQNAWTTGFIAAKAIAQSVK